MDSVELLFCRVEEVLHGLVHLGVVLVDDIRDQLVIVGHIFLDESGLLVLLIGPDFRCFSFVFNDVRLHMKRIDDVFACLVNGSIWVDMTEVDSVGFGLCVHLNLFDIIISNKLWSC